MERPEFESLNNWAGSYYELSIEYAPGGDDGRLLSALQALWHHPLLAGPFIGPYVDGTPHDVFAPVALPSALPAEGGPGLYGHLTIPNDRAVGCLSALTRLGSLEGEERGSDWLCFCIPMGMMELAFDITYPLLPSTNPWTTDIDHVLMDIAESIYHISPFDVAVIGEEAAAMSHGEGELTAKDLTQGGYLVSTALFDKLKRQIPSIRLASGLHWFPWPT